jgi:CheY-like chemotaxis protein
MPTAPLLDRFAVDDRRNAGGTPRPVVFLVSSDLAVLTALETDLGRRFGNDTRIIAMDGPAAALDELAGPADDAEPVALLIADERMPDMTGIELLTSAHALHPSAKRILLVERDYTAANPIVPAMMLGQIDYHLVKPWSPDHGLYPAVSEFLSSWARSKPDDFTMFRIAAREHSARGHEIRDLLTRFNTPFAFHSTESEEGAALLEEAGQAGSWLPTAVRHDGRVLVDPTDGDLVEALGGGTRLGVDVYDVAIGAVRIVRLVDGQEVTARTVVLAMGVSWRRLGIPRLEALIGAGVFYGAAASERARCEGSTSGSSAPAMPPARPPCISRSTPTRSRCSCAANRSRRACRSI